MQLLSKLANNLEQKKSTQLVAFWWAHDFYSKNICFLFNYHVLKTVFENLNANFIRLRK